jgi:hypothetical protein
MDKVMQVLDIGYKLAIVLWFLLELYCFATGVY